MSQLWIISCLDGFHTRLQKTHFAQTILIRPSSTFRSNVLRKLRQVQHKWCPDINYQWKFKNFKNKSAKRGGGLCLSFSWGVIHIEGSTDVPWRVGKYWMHFILISPSIFDPFNLTSFKPVFAKNLFSCQASQKYIDSSKDERSWIILNKKFVYLSLLLRGNSCLMVKAESSCAKGVWISTVETI